MAQGPFTMFNEALEHADLDSMNGVDTFKGILTTNSQALDATFVGGSGNCTYADLTAELSTANGYTNGGVTLSGVSVSRSGAVVTWVAADFGWTITGAGVSVKYLVIYNSTTGKLVCFSDIYTDGGGSNLAIAAGTATIDITSSGILEFERV